MLKELVNLEVTTLHRAGVRMWLTSLLQIRSRWTGSFFYTFAAVAPLHDHQGCSEGRATAL